MKPAMKGKMKGPMAKGTDGTKAPKGGGKMPFGKSMPKGGLKR